MRSEFVSDENFETGSGCVVLLRCEDVECEEGWGCGYRVEKGDVEESCEDVAICSRMSKLVWL